jgi:Arc/MetJ family transcription regulator
VLRGVQGVRLGPVTIGVYGDWGSGAADDGGTAVFSMYTATTGKCMAIRRGGRTATAAKKTGHAARGGTSGGFAVRSGGVIKKKAARAAGAGKGVTIVTEKKLASLVTGKPRKSEMSVHDAKVIRRVVDSSGDASSKVRKNMHIERALLDRAREATGAKTETETVHLALRETVKVAAFRQALLDGYKPLAASGWFDHAADDDVPSRAHR